MFGFSHTHWESGPSVDLEDIKNRKLVRWTLAYGVFAIGAIGFIGEASEPWGWSDTALRRIQLLLAGGFLPAVVLAWFHGAAGRQRITRSETLAVGAAILVALAIPFLAVREAPRDGSAALSDDPLAFSEGRIPIAVLPWTNRSGDTTSTRVVRRVEDEVRGTLSNVRGLLVMARPALAEFSSENAAAGEIRNKWPGLHWILRGYVDHAKGRIAVRVELENVATGGLDWSESFDEPYQPAALQALQRRIALSVTDAVRTQVTPEEERRLEIPPTTDSLALAYYEEANGMQGAMQIDFTVNEYVVSLLDAALARDPDFAEAIALKGAALTTRYQTLGMERSLADEGIRLSDQAVALNPDSYQVWWLRSYMFWVLGYGNAQRDAALRAIELSPSRPGAIRMLAGTEFDAGRYPEFLAWCSRFLEVFPNSAVTQLFTGIVFQILGDMERAEYWHGRALESGPPVFAAKEAPRVRSDVARGDYRTANARLDSLLVRAPGHDGALRMKADLAVATGDWEAVLRYLPEPIDRGPSSTGPGASVEVTRGLALRRLGRTAEATEWLDRARRTTTSIMERGGDKWPFHLELAAIEAILGNADAALDWLESANEAGMRSIFWGTRPAFENLEDHPRFQALLETMRLQREASYERIIEEGLEPSRGLGRIGGEVVN